MIYDSACCENAAIDESPYQILRVLNEIFAKTPCRDLSFH